jgi:lipoprotein signal peptidase
VELGIGYGILWKKTQFYYLIVAIALILAGAFGNIIDSVFYGVIFDDSAAISYITDQPTANIFTVRWSICFTFLLAWNFTKLVAYLGWK